jgi:hypothetical protein
LTSALHIPGVNRREIARAFLMAAETLVAEIDGEPWRPAAGR